MRKLRALIAFMVILLVMVALKTWDCRRSLDGAFRRNLHVAHHENLRSVRQLRVRKLDLHLDNHLARGSPFLRVGITVRTVRCLRHRFDDSESDAEDSFMQGYTGEQDKDLNVDASHQELHRNQPLDSNIANYSSRRISEREDSFAKVHRFSVAGNKSDQNDQFYCAEGEVSDLIT